MIATRTLSSERVALPLVEAICFLSQKLFSDGQDSLEHGQPGGCREQVDEPLQRHAERRRFVALTGERAVEDVEDRADDEERRRKPVEEELVAVLERDRDRGRGTEEHAPGRQRIRAHTRARETTDIARGEAPGSVG